MSASKMKACFGACWWNATGPVNSSLQVCHPAAQALALAPVVNSVRGVGLQLWTRRCGADSNNQNMESELLSVENQRPPGFRRSWTCASLINGA